MDTTELGLELAGYCRWARGAYPPSRARLSVINEQPLTSQSRCSALSLQAVTLSCSLVSCRPLFPRVCLSYQRVAQRERAIREISQHSTLKVSPIY